MLNRTQPWEPAKVPGYLELMIELDALNQDHQFRREPSYAFAWLVLGFALGGWLVMQWA
jgi:hypothetical protein